MSDSNQIKLRLANYSDRLVKVEKALALVERELEEETLARDLRDIAESLITKNEQLVDHAAIEQTIDNLSILGEEVDGIRNKVSKLETSTWTVSAESIPDQDSPVYLPQHQRTFSNGVKDGTHFHSAQVTTGFSRAGDKVRAAIEGLFTDPEETAFSISSGEKIDLVSGGLILSTSPKVATSDPTGSGLMNWLISEVNRVTFDNVSLDIGVPETLNKIVNLQVIAEDVAHEADTVGLWDLNEDTALGGDIRLEGRYLMKGHVSSILPCASADGTIVLVADIDVGATPFARIASDSVAALVRFLRIEEGDGVFSSGPDTDWLAGAIEDVRFNTMFGGRAQINTGIISLYIRVRVPDANCAIVQRIGADSISFNSTRPCVSCGIQVALSNVNYDTLTPPAGFIGTQGMHSRRADALADKLADLSAQVALIQARIDTTPDSVDGWGVTSRTGNILMTAGIIAGATPLGLLLVGVGGAMTVVGGLGEGVKTGDYGRAFTAAIYAAAAWRGAVAGRVTRSGATAKALERAAVRDLASVPAAAREGHFIAGYAADGDLTVLRTYETVGGVTRRRYIFANRVNGINRVSTFVERAVDDMWVRESGEMLKGFNPNKHAWDYASIDSAAARRLISDLHGTTTPTEALRSMLNGEAHPAFPVHVMAESMFDGMRDAGQDIDAVVASFENVREESALDVIRNYTSLENPTLRSGLADVYLKLVGNKEFNQSVARALRDPQIGFMSLRMISRVSRENPSVVAGALAKLGPWLSTMGLAVLSTILSFFSR